MIKQTIQISPNYEEILNQYKNFYERLGSNRNLNVSGIDVYDIDEEIGSGTITLININDDYMLTLYDYKMNVDVITDFHLTENYFEIEYCLMGSMYIQDKNKVNKFETNQLSVSLTKTMEGKIIRNKDEYYQGVSIVSKQSTIQSLFDDEKDNVWEKTINQLSKEKKYQYYLGEASSVEIAEAFSQILSCKLSYSLRPLYYESKIQEILVLIISKEVIIKEKIRQTDLTEYEIRQITKIPSYLMTHRYDLPNLKELTQIFKIGEEKLRKGFKLIYEDTIYSYHRNTILKRGADLLLRSNLSVDEIAMDLGYSSASNFVVAFKNKYHITPLKYREASLLYEVS